MTSQTDVQPYRVLARKYRPRDFSSLIGQDAMVRTLSNAIAAGRLAHAFMLTGVRGVGKTTTARIIARMLNCIGPDGKGGPTATPCGACDQCVSIAEDRNVDVMEIDAASHTGVAEMRELLEGVLYRPAAGRYKIYIVDEVHMLSTSSFNALLKTLEEPPEHIKFIFATTEIRKVPVTVLSRCQRFDLRRVNFDVLADHFTTIAGKEDVRLTPGAVSLITRAADGSVRDGLSLLDQAIAHAGPDSEIGEQLVRDMLGVAEHVRIFDLFEYLMTGDIAAALERFDAMYVAGADPLVILRDLAEITHWLTRLKAAPQGARTIPASDIDLKRGGEIADRLTIPVLTRTWQMLLKGIGEVSGAMSAAQTAEMVLVRIAFAADLPPPEKIVRDLADQRSRTASAPVVAGNGAGAGPAAERPASTPAPVSATSEADTRPQPDPEAGLPAETEFDGPAVDDHNSLPMDFEHTVDLFRINGEPLLHAYLANNVHLVRFAVGRIALRVTKEAPRDLARQVGQCLAEWTGRPWMVEDSPEEGEPPLREQREAREKQRKDAALQHPIVRTALETFPDARVVEVRNIPPPADARIPDTETIPLPDEDDEFADYPGAISTGGG